MKKFFFFIINLIGYLNHVTYGTGLIEQIQEQIQKEIIQSINNEPIKEEEKKDSNGTKILLIVCIFIIIICSIVIIYQYNNPSKSTTSTTSEVVTSIIEPTIISEDSNQEFLNTFTNNLLTKKTNDIYYIANTYYIFSDLFYLLWIYTNYPKKTIKDHYDHYLFHRFIKNQFSLGENYLLDNTNKYESFFKNIFNINQKSSDKLINYEKYEKIINKHLKPSSENDEIKFIGNNYFNNDAFIPLDFLGDTIDNIEKNKTDNPFTIDKTQFRHQSIENTSINIKNKINQWSEIFANSSIIEDKNYNALIIQFKEFIKSNLSEIVFNNKIKTNIESLNDQIQNINNILKEFLPIYCDFIKNYIYLINSYYTNSNEDNKKETINKNYETNKSLLDTLKNSIESFEGDETNHTIQLLIVKIFLIQLNFIDEEINSLINPKGIQVDPINIKFCQIILDNLKEK